MTLLSGTPRPSQERAGFSLLVAACVGMLVLHVVAISIRIVRNQTYFISSMTRMAWV